MNRIEAHARRIRTLNDNFRSTFLGRKVFLSQLVAELPLDLKARAVLAGGLPGRAKPT